MEGGFGVRKEDVGVLVEEEGVLERRIGSVDGRFKENEVVGFGELEEVIKWNKYRLWLWWKRIILILG